MRSHERKRGAKVTRDGDPEGYSSEKTVLVMVDGFEVPADNTDLFVMVSTDRHPGVFSPRRALQYVCTGTRETRYFVLLIRTTEDQA